MGTATPDEVDRWWDILDPDPSGTPEHPTPLLAVSPAPAETYPSVEQQDWADRLEQRLDEMTVRPPNSARGFPRLPVLAAAAVLSALLVGAVLLVSPDPDTAAPPAGAVSSTVGAGTAADTATTVAASGSSAVPAAAAGGCGVRVDGEVVSGAGRGDTVSGGGVILAFEYAYYVERSGVRARSVTTGDAVVPSAEAIQAGIDTVPATTTHCVRITPAGSGQWAVELSEQRPHQPPLVFLQTITTTERDGRVLITAINSR